MSKNKNLKKYRKIRSSDSTPEPLSSGLRSGTSQFVVQLHQATRLHYDFRLEMGGTLRSWAIPKCPSANPKDKRLAIQVEDHPVEYANFEGVIPKGNYGAGNVIVWDQGIWAPVEETEKALSQGKLIFQLYGHKLKGVWALIRIKKSDKEWLLIKERDAYASDSSEGYPEQSIYSGMSVDRLDRKNDKQKQLTRSFTKLKPTTTDEKVNFIRPMLAESHYQAFDRPGWLFEIKYDGYRLLIAKDGEQVTLFSRNGHDFTKIFPELAQVAAHLPVEECILDGELVILDEQARPNFRLLQKRSKLSSTVAIQRASIQQAATFYAFDLLRFNQFDFREIPLEKRKKALKHLLPPTGPLRYSEHFQNKGKRLFQSAVSLHLEGIVAKKANSTYQSHRSSHWLKVRAQKIDDFVVIGFTKPKRSRAGFGALLLGAYEGKELIPAGRVGTGFNDKQLVQIREQLDLLTQKKRPTKKIPEESKNAIWVKPELVAEVRYKQWTGGALRQPAFLRLRDDKLASECLLSLSSPGERLPEKVQVQSKKEKPKLTLSNLEKIFWPKEKYTKGDLIGYYEKVAPQILPYLKNRPLVLTRYPDGIEGKSFYQKDAPSFIPDWISTKSVWSDHSQRELKFFVCNSREALSYIINLGTIPLHIWASRENSMEKPDWCVLDLDPKQAPFRHVIRIAQEIRQVCQQISLPSFVKTSGSTGLHVLFPLNRRFTHEQSRTLGELVATVIVARLPKIATITRNPKKREGKVYLDYLQNGHGKTIAAPFCVRPLPGAPVSMPLRWAEVKSGLKLSQFTIETVPVFLKKKRKDPMLELLQVKPNLTQVLKKLSALLD